MNAYFTEWAVKIISGEIKGQILMTKFMFFDVEIDKDTKEIPPKENIVFDFDFFKPHIDLRDLNSIVLSCTSESFELHPNDEKKVYEYRQPPLVIEPERDILSAGLVTPEGFVALVFEQGFPKGAKHELNMPIEIKL